jgi:hypothetical protein
MNTLHPLLVMDYAFSYLGGAQTAVVQQALALARAGHAVTIAAPDASSVRELQGTGVVLHDVAPSFPVPFLGLPLIRADAATRHDLAALMDAAGTDLVLTHSEHGLAATALRLGASAGSRRSTPCTPSSCAARPGARSSRPSSPRCTAP